MDQGLGGGGRGGGVPLKKRLESREKELKIRRTWKDDKLWEKEPKINNSRKNRKLSKKDIDEI